MSDLTYRISIEHFFREVPEMDGCTCGWSGHSFAAHIAELTEQAVREQVAREIKAGYAEPPTAVLTKSQQAAWKIGMARAHSIARGNP